MTKPTKDKGVSKSSSTENTQQFESEDYTKARPKRRKVYERPSQTDIPDYVREVFLKQEEPHMLRAVRWLKGGDPDYRYLNRRLQEGYEFVKASELPQEYRDAMRIQDTQSHKGLVTNGSDVCIMKIDLELYNSRVAFYNNEARNELAAVDTNVLGKKGLRDTGSRSQVMMREPTFQD